MGKRIEKRKGDREGERRSRKGKRIEKEKEDREEERG